MAQKSSSKNQKTTIRRIKADDSRATEKNKKETTVRTKKLDSATATPEKKKKTKRAERGGLIGYFKGAWHELKQVRWPTRSATWSMTGAVLLFTLIFVILILLLDAGYEWLFEQILK